MNILDNEKFVRYTDGAKMYHMGKTKFQIISRLAIISNIFVMLLRFIGFAAMIFKERNTFLPTINITSVIIHSATQNWEPVIRRWLKSV